MIQGWHQYLNKTTGCNSKFAACMFALVVGAVTHDGQKAFFGKISKDAYNDIIYAFEQS
jgi:hypothetical protein